MFPLFQSDISNTSNLVVKVAKPAELPNNQLRSNCWSTFQLRRPAHFGMASSALLATELADEGVEGGSDQRHVARVSTANVK